MSFEAPEGAAFDFSDAAEATATYTDGRWVVLTTDPDNVVRALMAQSSHEHLSVSAAGLESVFLERNRQSVPAAGMTSVTMAGSTANSSAARALLALQWREFARNWTSMFFAIGFPLLMMSVFWSLAMVLPAGDTELSFAGILLPMGAYFAVTGVGLTGTAGPLAEMRCAGVLVALRTTPTTISRFIASHLAVRAIFGLAAGLCVFSPLGYLIGGVAPSSTIAVNIGTMLQLFTVFISGVMMPLDLFPELFQTFCTWFPTSHVGDLFL